MFRKMAVAAIVALLSSETQAVQVKQHSAAEWGFLKNIVNIDKFFDSGVKA